MTVRRKEVSRESKSKKSKSKSKKKSREKRRRRVRARRKLIRFSECFHTQAERRTVRENKWCRHEATATRLQQSEAEGPRIRKKPASGVEEKKV